MYENDNDVVQMLDDDLSDDNESMASNEDSSAYSEDDVTHQLDSSDDWDEEGSATDEPVKNDGRPIRSTRGQREFLNVNFDNKSYGTRMNLTMVNK